MPNTCVPKRNYNYDEASKVSAIKFPKDEDLRKKWIWRTSREITMDPATELFPAGSFPASKPVSMERQVSE